MEEILNVSEQSLTNCTKCSLHLEKKCVLIPNFHPSNLPIMFIEEIPTVEENKSGTINGKFWNIINTMLKPYNVSLEDIYCTSVVKCRPKENRYPIKGEVLSCFQWLIQEVNIVKPNIIVFFGKSCFKYFVHTEGGFETFNKIFHTRLCQKTIVTHNPLSLIKESDDYFKVKGIFRRIISEVQIKENK